MLFIATIPIEVQTLHLLQLIELQNKQKQFRF